MQRLAAIMTASRVCFLTDIEGNWSYVRNVVKTSSCLRFRDATERQLVLADDCVLVFGGDAGDKGNDTLHCYDELVRLKRAHPDRVVLLVGNRDVNKMRFTSEMDDRELDLKTMASDIRDGPVWVPHDKRTTLTKFLTAQLAASDDQTCTATETDEVSALASVNTKVNRLRWMLEHTMGSQGDFERRRAELSRNQKTIVSDDDVVTSFVQSVEDGGVLREYLQLGSLAFIMHKTLFIHGGIITRDGDSISSTLGRVPGDPTYYDDVYEWAEKLNAWYHQQLQEWMDHPTWTPDHSTRGGNELMEYVLPSYKHSVIMARHLDKAGMPVALPSSTIKSLEASGITRIIVGHTPHGICPTVIPQPHRDGDEATFREVIMCDTSYSDMSKPDNRGIAASDLVLHAGGRVDIRGVLENGRPIEFSMGTDPSIIGRLLRDGMRVKARLSDATEQYLVYKVENGYSYTYDYCSLSQLEEVGFVDEI